MKIKTSLSQSIMQFGLSYCPDDLWAFLYNLFLSKKNHVVLVRGKVPPWFIVGMELGDIALHSPTPKFTSVHYKDYLSKFHRHFSPLPGETAVDVGGCIGDTPKFLLRDVGSKGRLIVVEPSPLNLKYLALNLASNNVQIVPKAAWSRAETLTFHTHKAVTGNSIMAGENRKGTVQVQADTLDNILKGQHIDFAKIDVQGSEVEVIKGAVNLLRNCNKVIIETHHRNDSQRTYPAVLEAIKDYNFKSVKLEMDNGCVYAWR